MSSRYICVKDYCHEEGERDLGNPKRHEKEGWNMLKALLLNKPVTNTVLQ